ncbi:uncharacterized protein B0P05DRAFT_498388, partial [Gilbertella persicaria]|uniref:uncharacterized protein n=1 Tax=Gilbertella persicaria TaxID=101096 RepID=UPI00221FA01A
MSDNQRKQLIERYPAIQGVNYQPPATMPEAYARMSYDQKREDKMLKHHQYVTSAIFRPLDTLAHEISSEIDNPNVHRYLQIINDIRHLVLHANYDLTDSRKNIALKAINPNFRLSAANNTDYIMAQDEFHNLINNQFSTAKALQAAQKFNKKSFSGNRVETQSLVRRSQLQPSQTASVQHKPNYS